MRVGIFGGSFNPPHRGHVQALVQAQRELALDRVLVIPAATPPHKALPPRSPDAATRLALVRLAIDGLPWAVASDIELRREGPSYTADTLRELTEAHPGDELVLIVGTDMFLTLHQWYRAADICRMARIAYAARTDVPAQTVAEQAERLAALGAQVTLLHNQVLELSSTTVRRMLALGCAEEVLPPAVAAEIARLGLYDRPAALRNLPLPALESVCVRLLDPKRIPHVLGCRDTAVALARRYGCSQTDAARAALLHDITKAFHPPQHLQLCARYGMILPQTLPNVLHAVTGALAAERVFGESPAVCGAIRWHTTGKPDMTTLEKVLDLADLMEPTRNYSGIDALRAAAWRDLDEGLLLGMTQTIDFLRRRGQAISPETLEARDWLRGRRQA